MKAIPSSVAAALVLANASSGFGQEVVPPEGPNWCAYAKQYVVTLHGKPFTCERALRCIKMNNYGCLKQRTHMPWPGTKWGRYGSGAYDVNGHAIFMDPKYSLLGAITTLARLQRSGHTTALSLQLIYAPWCDTRGSRQYNLGWGRSCGGEKRHPAAPVGYTPMCKQPQNDVPLAGQCKACNCPTLDVRQQFLQGTGLRPTDPFPLFDEQGRGRPLLATVLRNIARQEQSMELSPELTDKAVQAYNDSLTYRSRGSPAH